MAQNLRVHGSVASTNILYSNANYSYISNLYIITVKNTSGTAIDLTTESSSQFNITSCSSSGYVGTFNYSHSTNIINTGSVVTISGVSTTGYNGSFVVTSSTYNSGSGSFTVNLNVNSNNIMNSVSQNLTTVSSSGTITLGIIDGVIESIIKEINPLAYFIPNDSTGHIYVVMSGNIDSDSELQKRIRNIGLLSSGGLTSTGVNNTDISGTTVVVPTVMTLS